jgi:hypothetical protein
MLPNHIGSAHLHAAAFLWLKLYKIRCAKTILVNIE